MMTMFLSSLRSTSRVHHRPSVHLTLLVRTFASQSGTVRFYNRNKGYGFIQPDDGADDIFVHRSGIVSDVPTEVSIRYPFLRKAERVRYEALPDSGLDKAVQVTWLDGTQVPPLRRNYLGSVHERAKVTLGMHVYSIMEDKELTEEEQSEKVRGAFAYAKSMVQNAEQLIVTLGMKVEDFPVNRIVKNGRVRYQFTNAEEEQEEEKEENEEEQQEPSDMK